jgi:anaerobic dimethyl sulfoxide reductase subunit A
VTANPVNQFGNTTRAVEALKKIDFVVVHEQFMTATARHADIILPANTIWERDDYARPWMAGPYYVYLNKVVESLGESKSDFDICKLLAPRLGIKNYSDKTEEEWLREIVENSPDMTAHGVRFEEFKRKGVHRVPIQRPEVAFASEISDPANNPFPTPSGKIEIYSSKIAELKNDEIPAIPKFIEPWEGISDPLHENYPLHLISGHSKIRAHSTMANIRVLQELERQTVWVNTADAAERGVLNSDLVRIFNERGEVILPAYVTERIMPGVVNIPEGAWFMPDEQGRDRGGCPNVLTTDKISPGGAFCASTSLVQVERYENR